MPTKDEFIAAYDDYLTRIEIGKEKLLKFYDLTESSYQRWRYHRWFTDLQVLKIDELLEEYGRSGWELIAVVAVPNGWYYIFKQPL